MPEKNAKGKKKKQNAIARWWRETIGEIRKIAWPTPKETLQMTKVVLVVLLLMSLILGVLDNVFTKLIAFILS